VLGFPVPASGGAGIGLELVARVTPGFPAIVSGIEVLAADPGGVTAPAADVEASTNNGLSWMPIAAGVPLDRFGNGSVTWTPGPATTGATALVRVSRAARTTPRAG